jgi:SAM-dependent methyltransferase
MVWISSTWNSCPGAQPLHLICRAAIKRKRPTLCRGACHRPPWFHSIPFEDEQFDRIFTFAAFHRFGENGDFSGALAEMVRVLKPGGKILLLYEPLALSKLGFLQKFAVCTINVSVKKRTAGPGQAYPDTLGPVRKGVLLLFL